GYSREMFSSDLRTSVGASNEFTIRFDFRDHNYHSKTKNARQINTQALALRRKTLVSYNGRGSAMQKSKRYKKKIAKKYIHSPNYRMNASKKLYTVKAKNKKSYNKRRKPARRRR